VLHPPHLSRDEAAAKMGHLAALTRCPWLKPQFNQAAFRGLKPPAPSGKRQRHVHCICGRKGRAVGMGASSSGSFALERRAQDDSKNRQRRNAGVLRLRLAQRARQTPLRMTASLVDRGRQTCFARPTLAAMRLRRRWGTRLHSRDVRG